MRRLLLVLILLLSACGKGSSDSGVSSGLPPNLPPGCKNLYSVWQSTTDLERHDFTTLANSAINSDWEYLSGTGATCGYASNAAQAMSAQMVAASGNYQFELNMVSSLALTGDCARYVPPGSTGGRYGNAMIKMTVCDEIQICEPYGAELCKTFH
jgi:hypothetical protein